MKSSKDSVVQGNEGHLTPEFLPPNLQTIMENLGAALCTVDLKFRYTSFNGVHAKNMKSLYQTDVNFGNNLLEMITSPTDRENVRSKLMRAMMGTKNEETQFYGEKDIRQGFTVTYAPIRGTDGQIS